MAVTVAEMLKMSQQQLDDLFTQSPTGDIPSGEAKGTAIVAPGTFYTQDIAEFHQSFCLAGESLRPSQRRFAKQDSALWVERDHREGL